jgi:fibronectin-binding autotransporter adhesin
MAAPQLHAALLSYEGFDGGTLNGQALSAIGAGTSSGFATGWATTGITTNNAGYTVGAGTGIKWSNTDLVTNSNLRLSLTAGSSLGTATDHSRFIRTLDTAAVTGVSAASTGNGEIWLSFMGQRNGTTNGGVELLSTTGSRFLESFGGFNTNNWNWSDRVTAGTGEVFPVASTNQAFVSVQLVFGATSTTIRMYVNRTGNLTSLTNVPSIENVIANTSNNRPNFNAISVFGGFRIDELRVGTTYADTAPVNTLLANNAGASTWNGTSLVTAGGTLTVGGTQDVAFDGTASSVVVGGAGVTTGNGRIEFRTGGHAITGGGLTAANIVNTAGSSSIANIVTARFAEIATGSTLTLSEGTLTNGLYGGGSLVKTGAGTLTLSRTDVLNADNNTVAQPILTVGRNNFTGALTISQGTLRVTAANAAGTGPITIGDAATGSAATSVALPVLMPLANAITVSNNGAGLVTLGSVTGATGTVGFSGVTTLNRPTTLTSATTDRTEWFGKITGPVGTLTIAGGQRTVFSNTTNDFTGDIVVTGANTVLQTGVTTGSEHIPNASSVRIESGAFLKLAGVAGATETINALDGAGLVRRNEIVAGLNTLVVGSAGGSGTFTGILENGTAGTLAFSKIGAGTQILGGTSTYTGATLVGGGTLLVNGSLAATNAVTVANTTTLGRAVPGTLGMSTLTLGSVAADTATLVTTANSGIPSINVLTNDGLIANGGAGTVTVNITGAAPAPGFYTLIDYAGTLGGGFGSFVKGTLPSRTTGNLVDNVGNSSIDLEVLTSDSARWSGALGSEWSTGTLADPKNWVLHSNGTTKTDFLVGDTVQFTDTATTKAVSIDVADVVPGAVIFSNTAGNDYTLGGTKSIAGLTGFTKSGSGKVTINNTNTFIGPVSLTGGVVSVAELKDAGIGGPLGAGSALSMSGGALQVTATSSTTNRSIQLDVGGGTVIADGTLTVGGVISGAGVLTKSGDGTLNLTAANTYNGGTTVSAGRLVGGANTSFGTGLITIGDTASNASIYLSQRTDITNAITVSALGSGTVVLGADNSGSGANAATFAGIVTLNRPTTFSGEVAADRLAFDGRITGSVGTLTIAGGQRTTFASTANDFVGDLRITGAGTILQASVATVAETIPNGSSVTVDAGAVLQLASTSGAETINALNGAGTVRTFDGGTFGSGLAVGSAGGSGTFSGVLQNGTAGNPLSLTKLGAGTQTLSGTNTYTGATTVAAGTLAVSGSISGSSSITVQGGATLDVSAVGGGFVLGSAQTLRGAGNVAGATTVNGTLAPGVAPTASPGTLTFNSTLAFGSASAVALEIGGTGAGQFDKVAGVTNLTLDGTITVTLFGGFIPTLGNRFDVLDWTGTLNASGFTVATDLVLPGLGADYTWDTSSFLADGTLAVVPEPASAVLLLGSLALVGVRRRRGARTVA